MSKYYGNIIEDDTIELTFNTFNSSGASVTVTTFASTDVHVHKDGGLTQTNAGVTIAIDFDGVTGNHLITIATTDAFYVTGSNYEVRVEGITVDGNLINAFIGSFSIENRFMRGTDSANTVVPPTEAQMNARTIVSANYLVEGDTLARVTLVDTVTTNTDKNTIAATDIVSAGAITTLSGAVVNVDTVDTATTVTDGAKDATVSKEATAAKDSTVAKDATVALEATLTSMKGATFATGTDSLEAIRNQGDAAWTSATGFATETKQDAGDVVRDRITDIQEADRTIDFTAGTLIYETKGTATVLLTKNLKDPAGAAVNSTEDVIAAEENV